MHPTAPLSSFNKSIAILLRGRGAPKRVLENILKVVEEIKKQNLRLDINTYNALLTAYSRSKDQSSVMRTFAQMKESDVKPNVDSYNIILEVNKEEEKIGFAFFVIANMRDIGSWTCWRSQITIKN